MRRKIVAGNWKMNLKKEEALFLVDQIHNSSKDLENVELLIFPPAIFLSDFSKETEIGVGAQNFHPEEKGAFTGEISVSHLNDSNIRYALIGHSERRSLFFESDAFIKLKVDSALSHGITPVFCCGEPLEIRQKNEEIDYVKNQFENSLFHLNADQFEKCIIAYEPVWAIGTGMTASVEQAEDMHASIRSWIKAKYGDELAQKITILYGGSCNPSNAAELFASPNVDGGLIGGASLVAESFISIAKSF